MKNDMPRNGLCEWGIGQWDVEGYEQKYRKHEVGKGSKHGYEL